MPKKVTFLGIPCVHMSTCHHFLGPFFRSPFEPKSHIRLPLWGAQKSDLCRDHMSTCHHFLGSSFRPPLESKSPIWLPLWGAQKSVLFRDHMCPHVHMSSLFEPPSESKSPLKLPLLGSQKGISLDAILWALPSGGGVWGGFAPPQKPSYFESKSPSKLTFFWNQKWSLWRRLRGQLLRLNPL